MAAGTAFATSTGQVDWRKECSVYDDRYVAINSWVVESPTGQYCLISLSNAHRWVSGTALEDHNGAGYFSSKEKAQLALKFAPRPPDVAS